MMNQLNNIVLIVVSIVLRSSYCVQATSFQIDDSMDCDDPVTMSLTDVGCDDDNNDGVCSFGDQLHASGSLEISSDLPSTDVCISTKFCFVYGEWFCKSLDDKTHVEDLCQYINPIDKDITCPQAGQYEFDTSIKLPGQNFDVSFISGWWLKAVWSIADCDNPSDFQFDCSTKIKLVSSSSSSSSSSAAYIAGGALFGVSSMIAIMFLRRRKIGVIDLMKEEKLISEGHFEMMSDSVRV